MCIRDRIHPVRYNSFAGTTNDGIVMGALFPSPGAQAELWDGTAWTETSALISTGGAHASAASGRVGVGALAGGIHKFGGGVFGTPASEMFTAFVGSASFHNGSVTNLTGDGSQFSASLQTQLLTSATQISNSISGSFTSGFDLQGGVSASFGITGFTWVAGGSRNTTSTGTYGGGYGSGIWGTKDGAIAAGNEPNSANTEEYNGTSWTEVNNLITARGQIGVSGCTTEAGVAFGGDPGESPVSYTHLRAHET